MATLHIQEYRKLITDIDGRVVMAGEEPAVASQAVTYSTSAQSAAFNAATRFIRVWPTTRCHLEFEDSPTATASSMRVSPTAGEYFGVRPTGKVAAYDGTS